MGNVIRYEDNGFKCVEIYHIQLIKSNYLLRFIEKCPVCLTRGRTLILIFFKLSGDLLHEN